MVQGEQGNSLFTGENEPHSPRLYIPWLILAVGVMLSFAAYFLVRNWEEAIIRADFELFSQNEAAAIHRELSRHMDAATAVVGLFDSSQEVERHEFREFSAGILSHHKDIQALMWVPRVAASERAALEMQAKREGLANFTIKTLADRNNVSTESHGVDYFPVYFVQPLEPNSALLGIDLLTDPAYGAVLEQARDKGSVVASGPIEVAVKQGLDYGIVLAQAVYRKNETPITPEARHADLKGYALQLFRVGDFIEESLEDSAVLGLDLSVYYLNPQGERQRIYFHPSPSRKKEEFASGSSPLEEGIAGLTWRKPLAVLNQSWELVFTPAPKFWASHLIWRSWVVSATGMLMSLLLGTYSFRLSRQTIRAESLTRSLARTNADLHKEIGERAEVEAQALKLSHAIEQAADALMVTDHNGIIEYVNPAFEEITGFTRNEAVGKKSSLVKSDRHEPEFYRSLWTAITRGEVFQDVFINCRKNGALYYEEKTITPLKDRDGNITHYIATGKDITERMQTQERLHYLAYNDALTELPNRLRFLERLTQALKTRRGSDHRLAIMYLDLDRFKVINDSLGHQVGDPLLRKIAGLLSSTVGLGDTVARLGGDEFGILLEDVRSLDVVARLARKILMIFTQPFRIEGHELYISTSIGISVYPEDGDDANALLKNADVAMYRAKDQGGNNYQYYSSDMSSRAFERLSLETSLRRALEREEFRIYYQPQVDLYSGKVTGAEALLRWQHPNLGLVSPLEFIPMLEESGLIVPVGEWVLRQACIWAATWQNRWPLRVAVNLSGRQFRVEELVEQVTRALHSSGLKPEMLEMEITESVLMQGDKVSTHNLRLLDRLGVRLAIDDFGTGYSSLSYLKRFPIKTLKIDRAFIRNIGTDQDDAAIVTAIVAMARSLKMDVVAEGVETAQQLQFLRELGCDTMQGFLISRPLPVEEINRFLSRGWQVLDIAQSPAR